MTRFPSHASRFTFHVSRPLTILLLLLFFLQVVTATTQTSLTSDEGPQLTSGYSYLVTGDPHLIEFDGHPPLAKVINALPLLLVPDLGSPADVPAWHSEDPYSLIWVTQQFFYPYRPLDRLVVAARLPVALLGVLLVALVYRWAADLFGPTAGLGALLLATFDPNLLAHAGLATNDLAITAGSFAALFTFWRFLRRPTARRALLAGVVLGLALGTKLNALLLLPTQLLLVLAHIIWNHKPHHRLRNTQSFDYAQDRHATHSTYRLLRAAYSVLLSLKNCVLVWSIAGLTLWATYGFEVRSLAGWPFPVPAGTHLLLWQRVAKATGGGHPAFLMGKLSTTGWYHYFPVAFAIKTPLPTLLALPTALVAFALGRRRRPLTELALGLFAILYATATVFSRLNIGYRHLLPILPFLFVFTSRLAPDVSRLTLHASRFTFHASRLTLYTLLAWYVVGTVAIWPFHLAFFNELIGGPDQGYRYLVDSNTDWGQAFKALHRYLEREGLGRVQLSTYIEYGEALRWYGIEFDPLPPLHGAPGVLPARFNPPPGIYVISTTTLQGIFTADPEMYDWFRHREPDARIGHAMFLYRLSEPVKPFDWVAQCFVPVAPLPPEVIAEGFGRDDRSAERSRRSLRRIYFDCTQSWLVPQEGRSPGWYVLSRDTAQSEDAFIQAHLAPTRLSFEQTTSGLQPPFAIYEAAAMPVAPAHAASVQVERLTFLGHTFDRQPARAGETVEVWTFWRVEALPGRPLSLMLHLTGPGGAPVMVGDGLGVPVEGWQVGDVIIQRHQLTLPPDAPAGDYDLVAGVYWLDTMERWPVQVEGKPDGDRIVLPPVPVIASR